MPASVRSTAVVRLGARERTFGGVPLLEYARSVGLLPPHLDDHTSMAGYFLITAVDGARATVGLAEADPEVAVCPILLATEQDGEPLRTGVRLVVPREGTRSVAGVVDITYHTSASDDVSHSPSTVIEVRGPLPRPGAYDLAARSDFVAAVGVDGAAHRGVPVHLVMGDAGMFALTDGEALAGQVVVVTSADGRVAVLAGSEVGPRYAREPVLLVSEMDGTFCLVVPYDRRPTRYLPGVVSLELREG